MANRIATTLGPGLPATLGRLPYLAIGSLSAALGLVGLFVPLLPTTVFLLVAAWAFARSSPRLHRALLEHPRLGPPIQRWQAQRCVSRRGKALAVTSMAGSFLVSAHLLNGSPLAVAGVGGVLAIVALYLATRPSCSH
ncbi:MAG: YbaN family protein [Gammaproteobacteria bacterium]|jgi:uncharacterized membrane protein YbaN (DUF454 family)|nr:YbaN family protein [Gammaproteobacteria bacterium]